MPNKAVVDEGTRVETFSKFSTLDGSWNQKDLKKLGHVLVNITLPQVSVKHEELESVSIELPETISNHKKKNEKGEPIPDRWTIRKKAVEAGASKTFNYSERPSSFNNLYKFVRDVTKDTGRKEFNILQFTTMNLDTGHLCLWTQIDKDNNKKAHVLAKINSIDATEVGMAKASQIAGDMAATECTLVRKPTMSLICQGAKASKLRCRKVMPNLV